MTGHGKEENMQLNKFTENEDLDGKRFTAWLEWMGTQDGTDDGDDNEEAGYGGYEGVYGSSGQLLYMHGEPVTVLGTDEENMTVSMHNEQNTEGYERFTIPYWQFRRDFGMWPPAQD
ncbi:MAG: hypothetical protein NC489_30685 [Ruminococcus flavefaciens]|nr:hypothetical protein [Ruminococcus flavefaciens]